MCFNHDLLLMFFKVKIFIGWILTAAYHSIILYVGSELFWYDDLMLGNGQIAGHWVWGTALYGTVLLTVLGKAALVTNNWTKYHVIAIPGSMAIWLIFISAARIIFARRGSNEERADVCAHGDRRK